ncbi:MAG: cytochrome C oxidase subunit IV family protein [Blastocatellia bacterium]|nr:cytochrome C oxidase subunit IV family protein [Blastocatellia bacterium]MCS7158282.1 cytochrome C oxidase subunit IV family protein [Blastocatellia bacterium]MCX7753120.1 cytochrome C oxidase subunit IV family protein [Blastocatellia bacterium]MDW8169434.1 cytochrome C oxidase subunit IV family protein [Acidobacteriota bacterium]MDW8255709.1 cytochrome C oxidase subunit IV family protein [Acidobacteriota bacterium]
MEISHAGHVETGPKLYILTWAWLLVLTAIEVTLAYFHLPVGLMLFLLMGLSVVKAALIMAHFMHLRFERLNLVVTLIPAMVLCITLLMVFFPDSVRALRLAVR